MRTAGGITTDVFAAKQNHHLVGMGTGDFSFQAKQISTSGGGGDALTLVNANSTSGQSSTPKKRRSDSLENGRPGKGFKGQTPQADVLVPSVSFSRPLMQEPWLESWFLSACQAPGLGDIGAFNISDDNASSLAPSAPLTESEGSSKPKRAGHSKQQTRVKRGRSQGWTGPDPQRQNSNDSVTSSAATPDTLVRRAHQRDRLVRTNAAGADITSPLPLAQVRRGSTATRQGEKLSVCSEESGKDSSVAGDRSQLACSFSRGMTQESILQLSDASSSSTREGNTPALGPQETTPPDLFLESAKHGLTRGPEAPARGVGGGVSHRGAAGPIALKADVSLGGNRPHYHVAKQEWRVRYYMNGKRKMRTYSAKFYGYDTAHNMAKDFAQYVDKHDALPDSMMMTAMMLQAQANANGRTPNNNITSSQAQTSRTNSPRREDAPALPGSSPGPHEESTHCPRSDASTVVARGCAGAGDHAGRVSPAWGSSGSGSDFEMKVKGTRTRGHDIKGSTPSNSTFARKASDASWKSLQAGSSPQKPQWRASLSEDSGSSTHQSSSVGSTPLSGASPIKLASARAAPGFHEREDSQESLFASAHAKSQEHDESSFAPENVASHLLASALSPPVSRGSSVQSWLGEQSTSGNSETSISLFSSASTPVLVRRGLAPASRSPFRSAPRAAGTGGKVVEVEHDSDEGGSYEVPRESAGAEQVTAVQCAGVPSDSQSGSREGGQTAALSCSLGAFQKLVEIAGSWQDQEQCLSDPPECVNSLEEVRSPGKSMPTPSGVPATGAKETTTAATAMAATAVSHQIFDTIDLFGEFIRGFAKEKIDEIQHLDMSKKLCGSVPSTGCFRKSYCGQAPRLSLDEDGERGDGEGLSINSRDGDEPAETRDSPSSCGTVGDTLTKSDDAFGSVTGSSSGEEDSTTEQLERLRLARGMLPRQEESATAGLSPSELLALSRALVDLTSSTYVLMNTLKVSLASSTAAVQMHGAGREAGNDEKTAETEESPTNVDGETSVAKQKPGGKVLGETAGQAAAKYECRVTGERIEGTLTNSSSSLVGESLPAGDRKDAALTDSSSLASLSPLFSLIKHDEDLDTHGEPGAVLDSLTGEKDPSRDTGNPLARKLSCAVNLPTTKLFPRIDGEAQPRRAEEETRPFTAAAPPDVGVAANCKRAEIECQMFKQEGESKAVLTRTTTAGSTPWSPGSLAFTSAGAHTPTPTRTSTANSAFSSSSCAATASPVVGVLAAAESKTSVYRQLGGDFRLPSSCKVNHAQPGSHAEAPAEGSSCAIRWVSPSTGKTKATTPGKADRELQHSGSMEGRPSVVETAFGLLRTHQRLAATISRLQGPVEKQLRFILRVVGPLLLPCVLPPVTKNEADDTSRPSMRNESNVLRARCATSVPEIESAKSDTTQSLSWGQHQGVAGGGDNELLTSNEQWRNNGTGLETRPSEGPQLLEATGDDPCISTETSQQRAPLKRPRDENPVTELTSFSSSFSSERLRLDSPKRRKSSLDVSSCEAEAVIISTDCREGSSPSRIISDERSLASLLLSPFTTSRCPCSDRPCPCDRQHVADMIFLLYSIPGKQKEKTDAPGTSQLLGRGRETPELDAQVGHEITRIVQNTGEAKPLSSEEQNLFRVTRDALRQVCVFRPSETSVATQRMRPTTVDTRPAKTAPAKSARADSQEGRMEQSEERAEGSDGQTCSSSRSVSGEGVFTSSQVAGIEIAGSEDRQAHHLEERVFQGTGVDMETPPTDDGHRVSGLLPPDEKEEEKAGFANPSGFACLSSLMPLPSPSSRRKDTQDALGGKEGTKDGCRFFEDQAAKDASTALAMASQALVLFSSSTAAQGSSEECDCPVGTKADSVARDSELSAQVALLRLSYPAMLACSLPLQSLLHTVAGMILSLHKKLIYRFICSHLRVPLLQEGRESVAAKFPELGKVDATTPQSSEGSEETHSDVPWHASERPSQIANTGLQKDPQAVLKNAGDTEPESKAAALLHNDEDVAVDSETEVWRNTGLPHLAEEPAGGAEATGEQAGARWTSEGEGTKCTNHPLQVREHEQCSSMPLLLDTTRITASESFESVGESSPSVGPSDSALACLVLQKPKNSTENAERYGDNVNSCDEFQEEREDEDDAIAVSTTPIPRGSASAGFSESGCLPPSSGDVGADDSADIGLLRGSRKLFLENDKRVPGVVGEGDETLGPSDRAQAVKR